MVSMIVLKIGMAYGKAVEWHLLSLTFTLMHWYLCSVRVPVLYKYGRKLVGDCTAKSIGCRKYVSMSINLLMI